MSRKAETGLQQDISKALELLIGGFWWKVHGGMFQRAGIGDLCGCAFGFYFNIEVKTPEDRRGKIALQQDTIKLVRQNGGCAFVTYSPQAAVRKARKWLLEQAPVSDEYREYIREALENKALREAESGGKASAAKKGVRVVHATEDWQDHYRAEGRRRAVETPFDPSRLGRRPKKRARGLGEAD